MAGLAQALHRCFKGKRTLVTGHTGLKGSWLTLWLNRMGAQTLGIALARDSRLSSFSANGLEAQNSLFADIRDRAALDAAFDRFKPEIVFHLAAQALVGVGYQDPVTTFETNVVGTANVLECIRTRPGVVAAVLTSSDKCYENIGQIWGYRERDRLGGSDPYSASKACTELVVGAYCKSYFAADHPPFVASARAGNVIGGGDWSRFRLVPDCIRGLRERAPIRIRNPRSTRPWQFVLDTLGGYLLLAMRLIEDGQKFSGAWNFGPPVDNTNTVERGAREIISNWGYGELEFVPDALFAESASLQLDCTKARERLKWHTILDFSRSMASTTAWYKKQHDTNDGGMREFSHRQIEEFEILLNQAIQV